MNAIGNHFLYQGRGQISYSIHVIAEYNLSGSEIICRQINVKKRKNPGMCHTTLTGSDAGSERARVR